MTIRDVQVGMDLPPLNIPRISRTTLSLFAGSSGDHQPSHLDIDAARAKGRDDVIAHGMLVMAYMSRLLTDFVPQERIRSFSARFVAVTPVHAEPVISGTIVALEDGEARVALTAKLADGKTVATGEAVLDIS